MQRPATTSSDHDPVPLRPVSVEWVESGIPTPSTRFLGREVEVAAVCAMLRRGDTRLITLVGPGGVGKTRLAIEVAASAAAGFPDGVRYARLADIRDPGLVALAIVQARGDVSSGTGFAEQDAVAAYRDFDGLLVIDNFEHVVAAAPLVAALLERCPALTVLVTSRTMLRLSGEHIFAVPPLPVPAADDPADFDHISELAAVRLFVDRARARHHAFALTPANAAAVAAICAAVDGLPLSIVLAAAHIDVLTPESLLDRLRQQLPLLDRGPIDAPHRHRSTRAAIAWSYDLLDAPAQAAFRRLAVCIGGFTLETAAAVIGPGHDAFADIAALAASSLLTVTHSEEGESRYSMLEPIREYALETLASGDGDTAHQGSGLGSAEEVATRDRHATHFAAVARWSDWAWAMPASEGRPRLAKLEAETANIRAALEWLYRRGDHIAMLRMAMSLGNLWVAAGHPREGMRWLEIGLRDGRDVPAPVRARAMAVLSWCTNTAGDPVRALSLAEASVAIWRTLDEPLLLAQALILCGAPAFRIDGRHGDAWRWFKEAGDVLSVVDEPDWVCNMRAMCVCQMGSVALIDGDIALAETLFRSVHEEEAARGFDIGESYVYGSALTLGLAEVARAAGDAAIAMDLYQRSLSVGRSNRNLRAICSGLGGVAGSLAALGNYETAGRLFGACEALHERLGFGFAETLDRQRAFGLPEPWLRAGDSFGEWQRHWDVAGDRAPISPIRNPDAAAKAWVEGRSMPLDEAIDLALAAGIGEPTSTDNADHPLSKREVEVLRLLVDGMTDAEVGKTLFISQRTAATHVRHIYDKLGVSSRAAAAAWAVRNGIA